ncbi:hypothetical protein QQF64_025783 [Cirrhinus molitorella]|uniref:Alpha-2-macroglobulin-like protein 1 n=1 Tax=Cirrhinus molitorella TaxID=172907 RepID=A0ABR3NQF7_9TELE
MKEICVWKGLILALISLAVNGQGSGPSFLVTFPAVFESGSDAKLRVSLLKPNESLTLTMFLVDEKNRTTQLGQQRSSTVFHRCFTFQAPQTDGEVVKNLRVVLQGRAFKMTEERKVMFRSYMPLTFIQTDKPIYNPGQTVNFRVVTMDAKFVPLDQMYGLVMVEDYNGNRINQWTNVSSTRWILQLSHQLNSEAQVGMYSLRAFIGERMISQVFEVKKYVLPKFSVTETVPQMHSVGDVGLKVEACAKYTYGQPVPGQAFVQVCREPFPYSVVPGLSCVCVCVCVCMNDAGCASLTISTSVFFNTKFENNLQDSFLINVNVTEEGTYVVMSKSTTVSITFEVGKVTFLDLPNFFDSGSVINGNILATYFNGTPIARKAVYLLDGSQWPNKLLLNLTTNQNGLATFSLNTQDFPNADLNLVASATPEVAYGSKSPYFSTDTRTVLRFQTATPDNPTFSELTIEKLEQPLKCDTRYPVSVKYSFVGEAGDYSADIIYMVLSRGVIVLHGIQKVQARSTNLVTSGTVSFELSVSVDMAQVVQILVFCVLPSDNVVVGSAALDTESCFQNQVSLQFSPATSVPGEGNVLTVSARAGSLCGLSAVDQSVLIMESGRRLSAEASMGMKVATNLPVREPDCLTYRGLNYYRNFHDVMFMRGPVAFAMAAPEAVSAGGEGSAFDVTVRTYFPETWIWQLAQVGDTGSTRLPLTVPDTITTWETEAFCLSSKGFGLAPPVQMTVFQPFFLELSLPYSIIRGVSFELKATVFNYLSKCIMVKVIPAPSSDFTLKPFNEPYSSCLCANGRKTFKWALTASVLGAVNVTVSAQAEQSQARCGTEVVTVPARGRVDVVTRNLLVLPEGVERIFTQSWLLCPKGSISSEDIALSFPTNVIQGSARCSVSVLGDIMGRALKNLDNLLRMPSGCGEQNMIVLAPNTYILQYLQVTGQLTTTIRQTAIGYLQSGYQGQLNYRHSDGSYSTFVYDASNTWLTAFVMRSFGLARRFIFIDPNVLQSAKDWLISKQGSDGCFMQQGTLYHNDMKGGVGDNVTMTGYIAVSLLELGVLVTHPVITNALSCLRPVVGNLGNTYITALLAYTFSLAGETSTRSQLLTALDSIAISEGSKLHWSQTSSGDTLAVEISSYVLLAVLSVQPLITANLGYANRIVNWLVAQQNPYGGFSSTQDTVVALHALSLYVAQVFSLEGSSSVTVQSSVAGEVYNFVVTRDNRLLYQEKPLKNVPGKYNVKAKGSSRVSVQVACFYNIPTPIKVARTLSVEVKVARDCKVPKGVPMTYRMQLKQVVAVQNLKPAVVEVYDYYQPSMYSGF